MKKNPLFFLFLLAAFSVQAQDNSAVGNNFGRVQFEIGGTLSSNGTLTSVSPGFMQYWSVGKRNKKFKVGLGTRLTSSFAGNQAEYITADANLTSEKVGPAVLFADQVVENIDTVMLSNTQTNALNLFFALHYDFNYNFGLEFNIDLLGLTFGEQQRASLQYDEGNIKKTNAYPTTGNLLLISDNDRGTLNSELMLSYLHKKRLRFKAGAVFIFNEYTLNNPAVYVNNSGKTIDTDRYRNKSVQFGLGVNYVLKYYRNNLFK